MGSRVSVFDVRLYRELDLYRGSIAGVRTVACRSLPIRRGQVGSRYMLSCRPNQGSACISTLLRQAALRRRQQRAVERSEFEGVCHTCFVLHFQPFFPSYGHWPANVAFRASRRCACRGSSVAASPNSASMAAQMAHPHPPECFRCSANGSSSASQPSISLWHRKQRTLSGLLGCGWK